ncbi:methyltransferase domain-containing protein [Conexibacter stalactiti]|uniref:Methyltransferase domain-containing protein n=1 Tax=Conexibacter stalactiti TaxID=1940611 RepID=A0ABU4HK04_9ACTN|nr:methyltransferase domain-containing protein [Conexibacter stalactiti]MDW5593658.1 methyltransferase domain-containing protein [Conexibacter stalactiti]MEC5034299.1 methyltransferase domain-containing protein [Conexibacter stalactiti]
MPDWQERIADDTRPSIRAEHELRYALAAPLIRASTRWCDLGCGSGIGAAAALAGKAYAGRALLVDREQAVADRAAAAIGRRRAVALAADLATPEGVAQVRGALGDRDDPLLVTCFETIEHLDDFAPLVALLVELAARPGATVVLSVPNDAFWAIENPHHTTSWGEGAVEELRALLPADHVVLHQFALNGSAIADPAESADGSAAFALAPGVPSHVLLAFGDGAEQFAGAPVARVVQSDVEAQRRWERQRESDLLYYATAVKALEERLAAAEQAAAEAAAAAAPAPASDDEASDAPAASGHA